MGRTRRGRRGTGIRTQMRRFISRTISKNAHRDTKKKESINRMTSGEVAYEVFNKFNIFDPLLVKDIDLGEVLSDTRGEGSLQRMLPGE